MTDFILRHFSGLKGKPASVPRPMAVAHPEADYPPKLKAQMQTDCGMAAEADVQRLAQSLYEMRNEAFTVKLRRKHACVEFTPWTQLSADTRRIYHDLALVLLPVVHPDAEPPGWEAMTDASTYMNWWVLRSLGARLDRPTPDAVEGVRR